MVRISVLGSYQTLPLVLKLTVSAWCCSFWWPVLASGLPDVWDLCWSSPSPFLHFCFHSFPLKCWSLTHAAAAVAAAKLLQSCPTLYDRIDGSPPDSPVPGILQARTLEWVAISFSNAWKWKVKVKSLSRARLLATPWTAAYQAPLSMGFSRLECWGGLPLPSPSLTHILLQNSTMAFPESSTCDKSAGKEADQRRQPRAVHDILKHTCDSFLLSTWEIFRANDLIEKRARELSESALAHIELVRE